MISALLFLNTKGDVVIARFYKDDVSRKTADVFREKVILSKEDYSSPVLTFDGCSYCFVKHLDIYIVAMTRKNPNAALIFQYIYDLIEVFKEYFEGNLDEDTLRTNFVLIYELLDEMMDHGYPQVVSASVLSQYIKTKSLAKKQAKNKGKKGQPEQPKDQITAEITGAIDWRKPGFYKYKRNEVYIDVMESVNLLFSRRAVLRSDVTGRVIMKTYLSGMPECQFGTNDKLAMEHDAKRDPKRSSRTKRRRAAPIGLDDCTFHRCVRLNKYDSERLISFIPPDGEFDLMNYRISQNIQLPFAVTPHVHERGRSRVEYEIKVKGNFSPKLFATNVVLKIPCPKHTSKANVKVAKGKCKYDPSISCIVWRIKRFPGGSSFLLRGEVSLVSLIEDDTWSRPPITMDFQVPMFTASGLHVRYLKVTEKTPYKTIKWVRYVTKAGTYQIRI